MEMDAVLYVLSSEGGWKDGKEYKQGTYYTKNGDKYTGQWDGNYEGQGEINYKDGTKYMPDPPEHFQWASIVHVLLQPSPGVKL